VLVANRGEIAIRVLQAARAAGYGTVAVYSDADRAAPHVRYADAAVRIGPPPAADSYLSIPALLAAAERTGADAVHPGYGFLSERAAFASEVTGSGRTFIGPPAAVIELMGDKRRARAEAVAAGVPVVPAVEADGSEELLDRAVEQLGLPLLVKAVAGGGGKGMRIVRRAEDLADALAAASREALAAFGEGTCLVERFVERGRHVEVQVLGDEHGNVVHLFERDCSVQRRHQKVLEESPAPTISGQMRDRLTDAAVRLAQHVGYRSAGTVEFLVDADEVYFLEMNTRLQVEHPVTEAVTGLDLVSLQLRVAQGEPLPFGQDAVTSTGHAIEARIYAEDAYAGFLPQAGTAYIVRWPEHARVDAALESGQVVSTAYDPLLGKVIVHGPDRETARRALVDALDDTAILGLTSNVGFVRTLAAAEDFRDARIHTAWLDTAELEQPDSHTARVFAAWTQAMVTTAQSGSHHPFQGDGWRLGAAAAPVLVELDRPVSVDRGNGRVDDVEVTELLAERHVMVLDIDGRRRQAVVNAGPRTVEVVYQGHRWVFTRPDVFAGTVAAGSDGLVNAPMPGTVLVVAVQPGQLVAGGDVLATLEAMKMELEIKAPHDATVTEVAAQAGDRVGLGQRLFLLTPAQEG
jgi:3-methylcrotonyl-CoA carboxylase alpha subunit/acetyl-CoA/propionyl-CoA carboxylase biotin carboxyl carrier protein